MTRSRLLAGVAWTAPALFGSAVTIACQSAKYAPIRAELWPAALILGLLVASLLTSIITTSRRPVRSTHAPRPLVASRGGRRLGGRVRRPSGRQVALQA